MRFRSDDQRKAMFAQMNKFARKSGGVKGTWIGDVDDDVDWTPVVGYTGAKLDIFPDTKGGVVAFPSKIGILLREPESSQEIEGDTVILAGKDYRADIFKGSPLYHKYDEESNRAFMAGVAKSDRKDGKSVFAKEPNEDIRRHKLLPEELKAKIPKLYSQENEKDPMVYVKYFTPRSNFTWYITEFDGKDRMFGWVNSDFPELGYVSLDEMANVVGADGMPEVERDMYFTPKRLSEVKKSEGIQD